MQSIRAAKIFGDRVDPRVRLAALFGGRRSASGQPPQAAITWARRVLTDAGVLDGSVSAVTRSLRRAEPRLTLRAAMFLVRHVRSPKQG